MEGRLDEGGVVTERSVFANLEVASDIDRNRNLRDRQDNVHLTSSLPETSDALVSEKVRELAQHGLWLVGRERPNALGRCHAVDYPEHRVCDLTVATMGAMLSR